jgi:hypothetical protein
MDNESFSNPIFLKNKMNVNFQISTSTLHSVHQYY